LTNVGDLKLTFTLDGKDIVVSGLRDIESQMRKLQPSTESTGLSFVKLTTAFFGAQAIFATVKGAVQGLWSILEDSSAMEQTSTAINTMIGDSQKAGVMMEELSKKAATTPFEFSDLANASKTLIAFGVNTDNVVGNIDMLSNVAQGSPQKLESLSRAFGKIKANARLTGEDLNMMIDAGFNPLNIISEKTGKSIADLRKQMEKGAISFTQIEDAFKTATSVGGQFYQMNEKQSQTISGLLSTLKDNFNSALREALGINLKGELAKGSILEKLKEAIQTLIPLIPKMVNAFSGMLSIFTSIPAPVYAVIGGFALFKSKQSEILTITSKLSGVLKTDLGGSFSGLTGAITKSADTFKMWRQEGAGVNMAMNETVKSSKLLSGALQLGLAAAIAFTLDQLMKLYQAIKDYMSVSKEMSDNLTKSSNMAKYQMLYQTLIDIQKAGIFTKGDIDDIQNARAEIVKLTDALGMEVIVRDEKDLEKLITQVTALKTKEEQQYLKTEKTKQEESKKTVDLTAKLQKQAFEEYSRLQLDMQYADWTTDNQKILNSKNMLANWLENNKDFEANLTQYQKNQLEYRLNNYKDYLAKVSKILGEKIPLKSTTEGITRTIPVNTEMTEELLSIDVGTITAFDVLTQKLSLFQNELGGLQDPVKDFFQEFIAGSGNAKNAFNSMVNSMKSRLLTMLADNIFTSFMNIVTGGGSNILGSIFEWSGGTGILEAIGLRRSRSGSSGTETSNLININMPIQNYLGTDPEFISNSASKINNEVSRKKAIYGL